MTEEVLKKAIEIKQNIDKSRDRKKDLLEKQSLCWGNTNEVRSRLFQIKVIEGHSVLSVNIAAQSAKIALEKEIKEIDEILNNYLSDLYELN